MPVGSESEIEGDVIASIKGEARGERTVPEGDRGVTPPDRCGARDDAAAQEAERIGAEGDGFVQEADRRRTQGGVTVQETDLGRAAGVGRDMEAERRGAGPERPDQVVDGGREAVEG